MKLPAQHVSSDSDQEVGVNLRLYDLSPPYQGTLGREDGMAGDE